MTGLGKLGMGIMRRRAGVWLAVALFAGVVGCFVLCSPPQALACVGYTEACASMPVPDCKDPRKQRSIYWSDTSGNPSSTFVARVTILKRMYNSERELLATGKRTEGGSKISTLVRVDEVFRGPPDILEAELDEHEVCIDPTEPGTSGIIFGRAFKSREGFWHIDVKTKPKL